ncbi:expressed unknown protein [Seminavis robusta]|uniref:Uncharacterized protein n=1 Tax=Seminavis robusta TaxID=568900 RepID=A0A9N8E095_9STRA|nr:expressed unknown protein [Seminavis robusta]|eukprot:Sro521_g159340.1 n/a (555) ;mRNA; r:28053-29717
MVRSPALLQALGPCLLAWCLMCLHDVEAISSIGDTVNNKIPTTGICKQSLSTRGGASSIRKSREEDPFISVARAIQDRLADVMQDSSPLEVGDIADAFVQLSSSQQTFKGLDGAAHEAYQRTHTGDDVDLSVRGRARRSAARAAATADGLGACELCELLEIPLLDEEEASVNGTLVGRQVLLNLTVGESNISVGKGKLSVVVLYEPLYTGGAGLMHGGIEEQNSKIRSKSNSGRLLVIVSDQLQQDLTRSLQLLDQPAKHVRLSSGLVSGEVASVQPSLYKAAGLLLETLAPILRQYDNSTSAIHFVGRSLAGGVANLAAIMLDGSLPMPKKNKKANKKSKKNQSAAPVEASPSKEGNDLPMNATSDANATNVQPLSGLGRDRTSCVSLGAPPCVSANVESEFIISILYGDDIICRASRASFDRLLDRSQKAIKSKGWFGGKQLNMMGDAFSLTMSSLRSHAHGSEGEELRLATPGRAYLLRPRRLGGACSIHEVGNRLKGGREALRAHILWQLDDILLSKSLWKHHQLTSYIHGLDRAHLRGFSDDAEEEEDY